MTRDRLLSELRSIIDDEIPDFGWSDPLLLSYLAEGQDQFCEETGYFVDTTNYTITTAIGTANYAIPDRVISIMDIFYGTQRLGKFQQQDKFEVLPTFVAQQVPAHAAAPYAWQADSSTGQITLYPTPTDVRTLSLRVWRYPIYPLDGDDVNGDPAELEIPSTFHRACIEFAAYKAYMFHDAERGNKIKATDHYAAFKNYVSRGKRALNRLHAAEVRIGGNPIYVMR